VGTYPDSLNNSCSLCVDPCSECSNSTFCLACTAPLYLLATNGTCHNASLCPSGTLPGTAPSGNLECLPCDPSCLTCITSPSNCSSCSSSYLLNGSCVNGSLCPNGSYPDSILFLCADCPLECSLCLSNSSCQGCSAGYYFFDSFCYSSCPNGSLLSANSCLPCTSPCATCSLAVSNCTSCLQNMTHPLFLSSGGCV
jgi:hypothetical protein